MNNEKKQLKMYQMLCHFWYLVLTVKIWIKEVNYMAIFCTIYYILSYIETVPQIIKLIKTKSSNDYSLGMISLQLIVLIVCQYIYSLLFKV